VCSKYLSGWRVCGLWLPSLSIVDVGPRPEAAAGKSPRGSEAVSTDSFSRGSPAARGRTPGEGIIAVIILLTHSILHTSDHHFCQLVTLRTHTPLSRTTWVGWYRKGKINLDFTEARDSEWQWHQLGRVQVLTSLQTDNHNPPLCFLQAGCPSCCPANSVKALKAWRTLTLLVGRQEEDPACKNSVFLRDFQASVRVVSLLKCELTSNRVIEVIPLVLCYYLTGGPVMGLL